MHSSTNYISAMLTDISLASFFWGKGKQNSPKYDNVKHSLPSGAILFAYKIFIEKWNITETLLPMPLKIIIGSSKQ